MNPYESMTAYLMILRQNLKTLHFNVFGKGFFSIHEELGKWADFVLKIEDELIERGIPLGNAQQSIQAVVLTYQNDILPIIGRDAKSSIELAHDGYIKAIDLMGLAKDGAPSDLQSKLDEIIYEMRKEADYKMARYLLLAPKPAEIIDEDD